MIKLVIFDLDGTLVNTIDDLAISTNYTISKLGFPEHELKEYPFFVGNGIGKLIERALPQNNRDETTIKEAKSIFLKYYQKHKTDLSKPYKGIPELLVSLQKNKINIAVASNKYQQGCREIVTELFPNIKFCSVLGQREGIKTKPDTTIINDTFKNCPVPKNEVIYIGDSGVDMQTGTNADIFSIGVSWGFRSISELIKNGAKKIVNTPEEIIKEIEYKNQL